MGRGKTAAVKEREEYIIESFSTVYDEVTAVGDYERAAWTMHRYLFGRGFTNYEIIPVAYKDYEPGILLSITIDGEKIVFEEIDC